MKAANQYSSSRHLTSPQMLEKRVAISFHDAGEKVAVLHKIPSAEPPMDTVPLPYQK